jgi:hypothetical protein
MRNVELKTKGFKNLFPNSEIRIPNLHRPFRPPHPAEAGRSL